MYYSFPFCFDNSIVNQKFIPYTTYFVLSTLYFQTLFIFADIFESTDLMSPDIIGFRTILHSSDDKSHIVCKCICPHHTTTFKVTFVLQNEIDGKFIYDIDGVI